MTSEVIQARSFYAPEESAQESGTRLAHEILLRLETVPSVTVSLVGVRGVASAYLNVVLMEVAARLGKPAIQTRVRFECETEIQRQVLDRCLRSLHSGAA